jgi:hypothetical protein
MLQEFKKAYQALCEKYGLCFIPKDPFCKLELVDRDINKCLFDDCVEESINAEMTSFNPEY